jgi:hypothetical protein
MNYPSIRLEGAILSPDILDRLEDAPGQRHHQGQATAVAWAMAYDKRFFHWFLEFPDVVGGSEGVRNEEQGKEHSPDSLTGLLPPSLPLVHDFHEIETLPENNRVRYTISPMARKEVLRRPLALNHQRAVAQAAAVPVQKKHSKRGKAKAGDNIPELF